MRMAVWPVHFGSDFLGYGVRSVQDAVDEIHVFYAPKPSYGFEVSGAVNPDTEERLYHEATRFLKPGKPFFWHRIEGTRGEGEHRDLMTAKARERGADMYITLDADEVWDPATAKHALDAVYERNCAGRWLCHFNHFWQSFQWMLVDSFRPIRIVDLRHPIDGSRDEYTTVVDQPVGVFHFGYAQRAEIMRYKFTCHSHSRSLTANWVERVYFPWQPGNKNLHPEGAGTIWPEAVPTPPETLAQLQGVLGDHPYWGKHPIR